MPSAYLETTVPSYYVARPSVNLLQASRQASTRLWWDSGCSGLDLFISLQVLDEAQAGDAELAKLRLALIHGLPRLPLTEEAGVLAETLIGSGLIPKKAAADAIHIATAAAHSMDYLITWNFRHIANPFTRDRLRKLVHVAGYHLPILCSPEELLHADESD